MCGSHNLPNIHIRCGGQDLVLDIIHQWQIHTTVWWRPRQGERRGGEWEVLRAGKQHTEISFSVASSKTTPACCGPKPFPVECNGFGTCSALIRQATKRKQQQKAVFENEAGAASSSYPSWSPFSPGNRSQQLAGHPLLSWKYKKC